MKAAELKTVLCPAYTTAKECSRIFSISEKVVTGLAQDGHVRSKTDDPKPATKLYRVEDVYEWMTT